MLLCGFQSWSQLMTYLDVVVRVLVLVVGDDVPVHYLKNMSLVLRGYLFVCWLDIFLWLGLR